MVVTVTAICGRAEETRRDFSDPQGWGQESAAGEHADQRPHRQPAVPTLLAGQRRAGQEVQCVPDALSATPGRGSGCPDRNGTRGARPVRVTSRSAGPVPGAASGAASGAPWRPGGPAGPRSCDVRTPQNQAGGQQHVRDRAREAAGTARAHGDGCVAATAHPADAAVPVRAQRARAAETAKLPRVEQGLGLLRRGNHEHRVRFRSAATGHDNQALSPHQTGEGAISC